MKYYISKTHVERDASGRLTGRETVLTKPDTLKCTQNSLRRLTALGIEHLHLCEHPSQSRRWGRLDREANKLRKTRKLTLADVAEDIAAMEQNHCKGISNL